MRTPPTKFNNVGVGLSVALSLSLATIFAVVALPPVAGSVLTSTSPVSATFLPSGEGWILSGYHCSAGVCVAVKRTMNAGRTWTALPLPADLRSVAKSSSASYFPLVQENIYFADAKNGWIYGSAQLDGSGGDTNLSYDAEIWSTHDGGATWSAIDTKSLGMRFDVLTMAASRGSVYVISWLRNQTFGLWRSSVATESWQRLSTPTLYPAAGGSNMNGALIFKGANAWLTIGNDRGATASARLSSSGRWVKWTAPCDNVGSSFSVPVAYDATTLVDVCTIGGYGGDVARGTPHYLKLQSNWVFTSHDAGRTFKPTFRVVADGTSEYLDSLTSLPASPSPGNILVAKSVPHGVKVSDHLFLSQNSGRTWRSVYASPLTSILPVIQFVSFASSSLGYAIVQRTTTTSELIISTNGGLTWKALAT
ncbi:MAG TPA: hypothetical protein VGZ68_09260 [Acidimicrobiales bacterium]|nr:hypothetical protein [Acidimicrobiales bacterium]